MVKNKRRNVTLDLIVFYIFGHKSKTVSWKCTKFSSVVDVANIHNIN